MTGSRRRPGPIHRPREAARWVPAFAGTRYICVDCHCRERSDEQSRATVLTGRPRHDHRRPHRQDRARHRRRLGHRARHGRGLCALRRDGRAQPPGRRFARRAAGRAAERAGAPRSSPRRAMSPQPGEAETMASRAIDALGRLDFLVNNAGTPATPTPIPFAELDRLSEDFWQSILNTNLIGPFRCTHAAVGRAEGGEGRDLQHRLDRRRAGQRQQHPLCDEQGRGHQPDAQPRAHAGAGDPGQCGGAGLCRQPVEQGLAGRPQGPIDRADAAEARLPARGHRRGRSSSCAPARRWSPARPSSSTAG